MNLDCPLEYSDVLECNLEEEEGEVVGMRNGRKNKKADKCLILSIKKYPVIYNTKLKDYRNVIMKASAWEMVAEECNRSVTQCQKKYKNCVDTYRRVINKMREKTGQAGSSVKPTWHLFDVMHSLFSSLESEGNSGIRGKKQNQTTVYPLPNEAKRTLFWKESEDEFDQLGKVWANKLRSAPSLESRHMAERAINEVLFRLVMGQIDRDFVDAISQFPHSISQKSMQEDDY